MSEELTPQTSETEIPVGGDVQAETSAAEAQKSYSENEVQDLLKALKSEREARKQNEKSLKESKSQLAQLEGIDPETYARLQAESAKRAELEAELAGKVGAIEKSYADQLSAAKTEQEAAAVQVHELQKKYAFERAFSSAGGRGGEFTDLAYTKLQAEFKLMDDGTVAVVDKAGAFVVDDKGKRVDPAEHLKQYKGHQLLGYTFQAERGAGSGLVPHPGTSLANGADMHSLSTSELFGQAFGRKVV
ncbi:hypothetical protein SynSYN20_01675 [Synechococcus sp. SYN20]|uniref:hypothetical protein n=1 Tax=Synechococcus sp. SYN20 TaxID=1050714 RepID=UPI001645B5F2|nr:hypothetical protein [Synechococcus sp. SYN20]QNJ26002.1 hypothetical protein SynSYN20_01675 [Synechococcus sp. SYN20]